MAEPKHTEGPWQAAHPDHDPYTIIGGIDGPDDGRMHFTEVCTVNENAADAAGNARLIAAAPDLLKALRKARVNLISAIRAGVGIPDFDPASHVTIQQIDAAIAKAEGRS